VLASWLPSLQEASGGCLLASAKETRPDLLDILISNSSGQCFNGVFSRSLKHR